jgi:simple sugar transport system permease protein
LIWLIFVIGAPNVFLSSNIYQAFMSTTPFFAMMAIPMTLVIISAEIDLSFPSVMALSVTTFSLIMVNTGNIWLAFVGCLLTGLGAGLLNGFLVAKMGIPCPGGNHRNAVLMARCSADHQRRNRHITGSG